MSDLLDRLEEHQFPFEDVPICLKPQLFDERDAAMARVAANKSASRVEDNRMVAPAVSAALTAALDDVKDLNDQIQAASITMRITGVDRLTYNRFVLANPPRRGKNETFDPTKFFMHVARKTGSYVDAAGETHEITSDEWAVIDQKISDGEYDRLAEAVIKVNRSVGAKDPRFFANVSETTPDSSETSD